MAPRAYWKGYLRLSLVSCPIQLFPATSEREKVRFHLINRRTGNRIKYYKVDAVTGEPVRDAKGKLIQHKYSVVHRKVEVMGHEYIDGRAGTKTMEELIRWIDSLDRL